MAPRKLAIMKEEVAALLMRLGVMRRRGEIADIISRYRKQSSLSGVMRYSILTAWRLRRKYIKPGRAGEVWARGNQRMAGKVKKLGGDERLAGGRRMAAIKRQ